ncbi:hypothetical protein GCM10012275_08630 [Longimycelium tulufanense]|uniref:Uncharacterized protein n=1 Tax=Longimycelium tulufanense TaxID=907463 RepID=A0A8J3FTH7_9PSEU|nr:hypothetical protein [Longimycelium tulufanense]GGM39987.1 hypothetical protein GCM10012275_08630 [Longimycelium tulufanense]
MYQLVVYPDAQEQVAALPNEALDAYAELLSVLELAPWSGRPQYDGNPEGAVRRWAFGPRAAGQVVYLILEDQREVHIALVQWWG